MKSHNEIGLKNLEIPNFWCNDRYMGSGNTMGIYRQDEMEG